jgi:hypothetical protein
MKNIEFKAELRNIHLARSVCLVVGARALGVLLQTDEYVAVPEGRLKRRVERVEDTGETREEWIWYDRPDRTAARATSWTRLDDRQVAVACPRVPRCTNDRQAPRGLEVREHPGASRRRRRSRQLLRAGGGRGHG